MTQCSQQIYVDFFHNRRCTRPGAVERDGTWYCRQHDPVERKARFEARLKAGRQKWADKAAAKALRQRYERIGRLVCENVGAIRFLASYRVDWPEAEDALEAILKEVDKP